MNRESGNVPVRTLLISQDLLRKLVIADTPGSGDPQVINEMIQDFLPICDYVIYFISAANPIDQADLPLLQQKTHKLPFIPIIFVVSRTDEFRKSKILPLNEENIDLPKKDQFLGQLISRIKEIIKIDSVKTTDFIFIDNEFHFGVEELKEKVASMAINGDKEAMVRIHGYKIEYYRVNLNSIYTHFLTMIDEKIRKSKDFLKTANENIQRFDKSIELNNEKLKLLWVKSESLFKEEIFAEKKSLADVEANDFPVNISNGDRVILERKAINKSIDDLVNGYMGRIVLDLNNQFKQKIRDVKQNLLSNISEGNVLMENISHLFPGRIDLSIGSQTLDVDFSKLNDYEASYLRVVTDLILDIRSDMRNKLGQIRSQITKESLIKLLDQLYEQGKTNISENFDQYFERIQMYRSTVLTRNTKETIEKLRIGTQLDELDDEFSDDYISAMKAQAIMEVYFDNNSEISDLQQFCETINSALWEIRKEVDNLSIPLSFEKNSLGKEGIDLSQYVITLISTSESSLNRIYQSRLNELLEQHTENYGNYIKSISELKKTRRRQMLKWTLVAGLCTILFYIGLRFSNIIKPPTIIFDIITGLAATVIGNVIGYIFSMLKADIKKLSAINTDKFIKQEKNELLQMFNEDFWDELSKKAIEPRTDANPIFLRNLFNKKLEPIILNINFKYQVILTELQTANKKMISLIEKYREKLDFFYNKHIVIFQDTDNNVGKIEQITRRIKETAIKPSFDLLNETTNNLENVKREIQDLRLV